MMCADFYSMKPLKEVDQDPGCSDSKKRCDSSKNFLMFQNKKVFKIRRYHTCTTPNKRKVKLCSIVKHSIGSCTDTISPSKYLRFVLTDCVINTESNSKEDTDDFLLERENFWIGTLCTIHKGLNKYHAWRGVRRKQKFNINDW